MSDHPTPPTETNPSEVQQSKEAQADKRPHRQDRATPSAPATAGEWVTIGRIVAVFGIHGELKVILQSDIPDRFARLRSVYLGPDHQRYRLTKSRPYRSGMLVISLAGIQTANDAEALIGHSLTIPLAELPELPPDQYYIHDLIGLRAETPSGQALGAIVDVLATGGNDVYIIRETSGRDVLVPAIKDIVKRVDIAAGVLIIDPIPGLFDNQFEVAG
ncbi:MAG TPA: ribosome maturation factor RimM [Ktedonobacterales bacterium]|nr:ribosome maturation factor RimM [Ktedonobacterales bacterium]